MSLDLSSLRSFLLDAAVKYGTAFVSDLQRNCVLLGILFCLIWIIAFAGKHTYGLISDRKQITSRGFFGLRMGCDDYCTYEEFIRLYGFIPNRKIESYYDDSFFAKVSNVRGVCYHQIGFRTKRDLRLYREYLRAHLWELKRSHRESFNPR